MESGKNKTLLQATKRIEKATKSQVKMQKGSLAEWVLSTKICLQAIVLSEYLKSIGLNYRIKVEFEEVKTGVAQQGSFTLEQLIPSLAGLSYNITKVEEVNDKTSSSILCYSGSDLVLQISIGILFDRFTEYDIFFNTQELYKRYGISKNNLLISLDDYREGNANNPLLVGIHIAVRTLLQREQQWMYDSITIVNSWGSKESNLRGKDALLDFYNALFNPTDTYSYALSYANGKTQVVRVSADGYESLVIKCKEGYEDRGKKHTESLATFL